MNGDLVQIRGAKGGAGHPVPRQDSTLRLVLTLTVAGLLWLPEPMPRHTFRRCGTRLGSLSVRGLRKRR